jgi:hypothetical protein
VGGKRTSDKSFTSHGTCAASVAFGDIGIMIQGTLVAVEVNELLSAGDLFAAFGWAIDDIVANKRQGRSVINLSLSSKYVNNTKNDIHSYVLITI